MSASCLRLAYRALERPASHPNGASVKFAGLARPWLALAAQIRTHDEVLDALSDPLAALKVIHLEV